jgi:hypothetical protein
MTETSLGSRWSAWTPVLLSVLRIVAAFLFIQYGTMKLFGWPIAMPDGTTPHLMTQTGIGGMLEVFGGALLLIGLFTRLLRSSFRGKWRSPTSSFTPRTASGRSSTRVCRRSFTASSGCTYRPPAAGHGARTPSVANDRSGLSI